MCKVLLNQEDEFFQVVNPKLNLPKLKHKKVITEHLKPKIENADDEAQAVEIEANLSKYLVQVASW